MARKLTTEINENEYIGDSLLTINTNFNNLDTACQILSSSFEYKQGTFLPVINSGYTGNGAYDNQYGNYTRLGNQVFFNLRVDLGTGWTPAASQVVITGLPYTSPVNVWESVNFYVNGGSTNIEAYYVKPIITQGTNRIGLWKQNAAGIAAILGTSAGANLDILMTGHYQIQT